MLRATTACTFSTSQLPKVVRACGVLYILTWKCASRHNGVHFFDISTSKKVVRACGVFSILTWKCASRHNGVHFFDISTSKEVVRTSCFAHFDLEMCLAPQRRAFFIIFSSLIWPDCSAPAALASLLFDPSEPQSLEKHSVPRLSHHFAHLDLLSSDCLFFDPLSSSLLFSYSSHLCFSSVHIVGSLPSRIPSMNR